MFSKLMPSNAELRFLFFKQTSPFQSYFTELCVDVAAPDNPSIVFSDIESADVGTVSFRVGPRYERKTLMSRLLSWLRYFCQATRFAFGVRGKPVIFMVSQPPFLPLLGYLQKKLLGRPYVIWVDDVYPDAIERKGLLKHGSVILRLWRGFNHVVFAEAAAVITLGPYMKELVEQYVPRSIPVTVIPTWVDTDFILPVAKDGNPFASDHGQTTKTTVMYSGNLGLTHDVNSILEAARRLRSRSDLHFMIIGAGPRWSEIAESIERNGNTNITLLPLQAESILPFSLATADIALVSLETGMEGISMPSKTYYCMAAGAAIVGICPERSDLAYVIREHDCGASIAPGDADGLARIIDRLSASPNELARLRRNARTAAVQTFSRDVNTRTVRDTLMQLAVHTEAKTCGDRAR